MGLKSTKHVWLKTVECLFGSRFEVTIVSSWGQDTWPVSFVCVCCSYQVGIYIIIKQLQRDNLLNVQWLLHIVTYVYYIYDNKATAVCEALKNKFVNRKSTF